MCTLNRDQVLASALAYADLGLRVVPIRPGRKHPPIPDWPTASTSDPTVIRSWWTGTHRHCGVGIATGVGSRVWVLDVDVVDGKPGAETLAGLEARSGRLPATVEAITGTAGRHLFFAWDDEHPVRNDQSGRLGAGLDVRGEGGLVVAAPSIHPATGRPYQWRRGHGPGEQPFAQAPGWLRHQLGDVTVRPAPANRRDRAVLADDDSPAAHFNASTTWDGLLRRDGWTLARQLPSGEQGWTRPGKAAREGISATVGHGGRDVLKVFTSSVPGLEADRAYSRFGYEAAVRHCGDRSALAAAIRRTMTSESADRQRLRAYAEAMPGRRPTQRALSNRHVMHNREAKS